MTVWVAMIVVIALAFWMGYHKEIAWITIVSMFLMGIISALIIDDLAPKNYDATHNTIRINKDLLIKHNIAEYSMTSGAFILKIK